MLARVFALIPSPIRDCHQDGKGVNFLRLLFQEKHPRLYPRGYDLLASSPASTP